MQPIGCTTVGRAEVIAVEHCIGQCSESATWGWPWRGQADSSSFVTRSRKIRLQIRLDGKLPFLGGRLQWSFYEFSPVDSSLFSSFSVHVSKDDQSNVGENYKKLRQIKSQNLVISLTVMFCWSYLKAYNKAVQDTMCHSFKGAKCSTMALKRQIFS